MNREPPDTVLLGELVARFGGELRGDPARRITGVATLGSARPDELSFLANPRYRKALATTQAAAVLVDKAEVIDSTGSRINFWISENPYACFAHVAQFFFDRVQVPGPIGIHPTAVVHEGAVVDATARVEACAVIESGAHIGAQASIGAGTVIGARCAIGPMSRLHARVTIYADCTIGARAIIHSGVVIGADGFGFAHEGQAWVKIPQTGRVVVGDDVEIGANTTIDRGALGDTVVADGVKLDNQIQVAHNVEIGEHSIIAGCTGIAGSAKIGKRCMIGGAAMILGHLTIADDVSVSVATVVSRSISKPGLYTGFFPMAENSEWERNAATIRHLDELRDRIRILENKFKKGEGTT